MDPEEQKLNPIPYAIRELLVQSRAQVHSFWDLHQHSSKKSMFVYGPYYPLHSDKYLKIRLIPKLLSERSPMFRFYSCRFRLEKYKESCARMAIGRQFGLANCFTLECSAHGYINKAGTVQFKEADLIEFGKNLAESVLEYTLLMERDAKVRRQIIERMKARKVKLDQARQPSPPLAKHVVPVKRSFTQLDMQKEAMEAVAELKGQQSEVEVPESVNEYDEEDEEEVVEA